MNLIGSLISANTSLAQTSMQTEMQEKVAGLDQAWWTGITIAAMLCLFLVVQSVVME